MRGPGKQAYEIHLGDGVLSAWESLTPGRQARWAAVEAHYGARLEAVEADLRSVRNERNELERQLDSVVVDDDLRDGLRDYKRGLRTLNEVLALAGIERDERTFTVASCPVHGLHGARDTCFVCGRPCTQVPMVPA